MQTEYAGYASLLTIEEQMRLLEGNLFGFTAFWEGYAVGILLYEKQMDALWISRIYVDSGYRRQGIAKGLLQQICNLADAAGTELRLSFDGESIRDPLYRLLASTHAFYLERAEGFEAYLTEDEVSDICKRYAKRKGTAFPFFSVPEQMQSEFIAHIQKEYPLIAWELEEAQGQYHKDLSFCVTDGENIQAVSLLKRRGNAALDLQLLYSLPGKGLLAAVALQGSIAALAEEGIKPVYISVVNEASMRILDKMCPHYRIVKRFYMAYYIGQRI